MGVIDDAAFQEYTLALAIKDRKFLKRMTGIISSSKFTPKESDGVEGWARYWVAKIALRFFKEFGQPVGGMLRPEALEYIRENKNKMGNKSREALLSLVEKLRDPEFSVAPESIEKKWMAYAQRQRFHQSIQQLISLQGKGELTPKSYLQITRDTLRGLDGLPDIVDYGKTLEQRFKRRSLERDVKLPYLFIECIDENIKTAPRGQIQMILAKYGVGKSTAMVHIARAYAMQGYNVLFFTLEDPKEIVENRLDASIAGFSVNELPRLRKSLREAFVREWAKMKAGIQVVNATGGGWTVERLAEVWEVMRNRGFLADMVILDYDKKIEPPRRYKGDNAPTLQSTDIYIELSNWAARDQIFMWVAAQARRGKEEKKMIVSGDDAAEDINKLREAGLCLGIGYGPKELAEGDSARYIYVAKNRFGRQMMGWPIVGDFDKSIFYDPEPSRAALAVWNRMQPKV